MFERFTRKSWLAIGAAVVVVVVVVVAVVLAAGGDDDGDVATGTTEATSTTTRATSTTTGGPTTTAAVTTSTTGGTGTSSCAEPEPDGAVLARVDLDGDGIDELFVRAAAGGPRDVVALFRVTDCELVAVTLDGAPAEFPVGASVRAMGGVECRGGTVRVYVGESADGETYDVTWRDLRLDGSTLTQAGEGRATAGPGDELLTAASTLSCG